jgi:ABC-type transport system involved in multi-copper enzyme maturation permease subunit
MTAAAQSTPMTMPRGFWARLTREPNAIWMREMRQAARLGRTPWILFSLTLTISLLMCSIGGIAASSDSSPATLGGYLFQVFFSIAYFVVTIVGPAIAANSIASEREGRTWEAVLLTGLTATQITRGKFFAAYTTIALYIVVLAPVGALSFLFGGVTATEVVVAFAFLFVLAALAVAFGLGVSSLMSSLRGAIVVTLMLAICIGPLLYTFFGFMCSFGVHALWPEVNEAFPIWLPLAYTRAPFGLEYVALLMALPLLLMMIPAWFLYEATIANLTNEADDRSTRLKRWYVLTSPLLALACALPSAVATSDDSRVILSLVGISAFALHVAFCALLFTSDPPGPSRRVRIHWDRERASRWRRFFGPGLAKTALLVAFVGVVGICGIAVLDIAIIKLFPTSLPPYTAYGSRSPDVYAGQIFVFAAYAAPFAVFLTGLVTWLRARSHSPWVARLITLATLFLVSAGPWVIAAIGGVLSSRHDDDWLLVGAPSPFFVIAMVRAVDHTDPAPVVAVGIACAAIWGFAGIALLASAGRRCARTVAQHNAAVAQAEAALQAEEEALTAATTQSRPPTGSAPVPAAP